MFFILLRFPKRSDMITSKAVSDGKRGSILPARFLDCSDAVPPVSNGLERIVTIYVGNLSFQATEEDLREVFKEYGEVSRISLPTDRETGRKRGFAFVEMKTEAEEDVAIQELDGAEWLGREIRVNKAKPREGGGGGGGGGGNRRSHSNDY